jgi:NAD-dependent dihydropyrimidine dehydrogenase PreA subunit
MPYVIADPCIDIMDKTCMEECPVDCIYEGARKLYIHPTECIDCSACEPVCPVEAISPADDIIDEQAGFVEVENAFFAEPLPGRDEPLGSPGGAGARGPIGVDVDLVASYPEREPSPNI